MIPENRPIQIEDLCHMSKDELELVRIQLNSNTLKSERENDVLDAIDIELRKIFGSVYF